MFDMVSSGSPAPESVVLVQRICAAARAENRAAAAQLVAIHELFRYRLSRCAEADDWAVDTMAAVGAEIAAALRISPGLAAGRLRDARALCERLPRVGAVFAAGDIDYRLFTTIAYRTDLIVDETVLATVDAQVAAGVARWPSMTRGRLAAQVDNIVARADADAVRRRKESQVDREVWIAEVGDGLAEIQGQLFSTDARALDQRLDALAATVCAHDPRSRDQRRADALGALAAGADRLGCRCARPDCAAGKRPAAGPVVIHLIAEQATLEGTAITAAAQLGADGLITAELVQQLAASATLRPLIHPADAPAENGYLPSTALADFVRCRDLTCRAPGCDHPAVQCDVDHTIPHARGGPTHAANLKCLCRLHHLLKTFCGWRDQQLADGTVIWRLPDGHTYITTPGSALLFPSLCAPTADLSTPDTPDTPRCGERTARMPRRRRTRAQQRATRIATERRHNRQARLARKPLYRDYFALPPPTGDEEPPPF
ncbi:HNH endonuclease signature motif containing protein [Mycobacterium interjectum]|uniref:HNH endonuclease signature motif containing protein n=1 Tax=Mycobacterium interjectum TaxID=33895 RepID=UPI000832755E|nr:HNH endonuclease signature motif containing protein [Mycobacterium interjectum]